MSKQIEDIKHWNIDWNKRELFEFDAGYKKNYRFKNDSIVSIVIMFYEMDIEESQINTDILNDENRRWC